MFDKELSFTFTVDSGGEVFIEAEDYAGEYTTWQNIEDGEEIENAISIVSDEDIKNDLSSSYDTDVLYTDLTDFDYDEDDMSGSFILNVTFDSDEDPMENINESLKTNKKSLNESVEHDLVCPDCGCLDIYNDRKDPHYYHCSSCGNTFHEDEAEEYCRYFDED